VAGSQLNLPHGTKKTIKRITKKAKNKNRDAQKKRISLRVREVSPMRPQESLWWERFVKEVGFEPGVKG